jgi:hypothetical protein
MDEQLESEFVLIEKPQLAWGNQKRSETYSLVGQGLVLKRRATQTSQSRRMQA